MPIGAPRPGWQLQEGWGPSGITHCRRLRGSGRSSRLALGRTRPGARGEGVTQPPDSPRGARAAGLAQGDPRPSSHRVWAAPGAGLRGGVAGLSHAPLAPERDVTVATPEVGLVRIVAGQPAGAGRGDLEPQAAIEVPGATRPRWVRAGAGPPA
uniref:Uncharacterized protein n=1 Tax=Myotis myotis TaxID=51298 RepID=A0A7J7R1D2_MYOMY|nr:hypothetical protein mMyoMyo1_011221 [Myotis myotis]